jgi:rhamnosyltransferase subunit B
MRVLIATLGSAGDVHPMLAIAQSLLLRGHQVELLSHSVFGALARQLGVGFHPIGTADQYAAALAHPKLWHPIDGLGVMWRGIIKPAMVPVYERIRDVAHEEKIVLLASPIVFGARLAQERLGIPLVTAYTAATMVRSVQDPLTIAQWRVPPRTPRWARRAAWMTLDRFKLEPMARPALDAARSELGLRPAEGSIFGAWMHSPDAGVTLFPDWFAMRASDWPAQIEQAGFPLFDGDRQDFAEPELQAFLDQGAPPVVFAPGTAAVDTQAFFTSAVSACEALGLRGVLLSNGTSQVPGTLPGSVHVARYAPFSWLLPKACALVHHGGIGSCAQAMQAGIPQVTVPRGYDQFDNTSRIERLGIGRGVWQQGLDGEKLADALRALLDSRDVAQANGAVRKRIDPATARDKVCAVVERFR